MGTPEKRDQHEAAPPLGNILCCSHSVLWCPCTAARQASWSRSWQRPIRKATSPGGRPGRRPPNNNNGFTGPLGGNLGTVATAGTAGFLGGLVAQPAANFVGGLFGR